MERRSILNESKAGALSQSAARKAAHHVKETQPELKPVTPGSPLWERFLGHFGPRTVAGFRKGRRPTAQMKRAAAKAKVARKKQAAHVKPASKTKVRPRSKHRA
jgi:hypothetical protein